MPERSRSGTADVGRRAAVADQKVRFGKFKRKGRRPSFGGIGLGIRESDGELREKFNTAIQSMKDDGSLNALIEEWLPGSATF